MNAKMNWVRTLRAIVVAAVLLMALIVAVLGSIGTIGTKTPFGGPVWMWASDPGTPAATVPPDPVHPAPG